jgi:hypothetical protein
MVTIVVRPTSRVTLTNGAAAGANQSDPVMSNNIVTTRTVVR